MAHSTSIDIELEAFRPGYPRFAMLLSTDAAFQTFRRFIRLRMRLLLLKQDEVSVLQQELDTIDEAESKELFLGCHRRDGNETRRLKIQELTKCLAEYDSMLDRCCGILSRPQPDQRDVASLREWTNGTGSIARLETSYLNHNRDLMNLTGASDSVVQVVEHVLEDCVFSFQNILQRLGMISTSPNLRRVTSSNTQVFVATPYLKRVSRILTTWLATIVVLAPVVILDNVSSFTLRLILIVLAGGLFLSCVSLFTNARTVDLFAVGASYTAVLVVFTATGQQASSKSQ